MCHRLKKTTTTKQPSRLELIARCEPSTCQPTVRWLSHYATLVSVQSYILTNDCDVGSVVSVYTVHWPRVNTWTRNSPHETRSGSGRWATVNQSRVPRRRVVNLHYWCIYSWKLRGLKLRGLVTWCVSVCVRVCVRVRVVNLDYWCIYSWLKLRCLATWCVCVCACACACACACRKPGLPNLNLCYIIIYTLTRTNTYIHICIHT